MKFKVGDRVETKIRNAGKGTIIRIYGSGEYAIIGVKFNNYNNQLHDLSEECKPGFGLWLCSNQMELIHSNNILILMI